MSEALADRCPTLFRKNWPARRLEHAIASISSDVVQAEYVALRESAPRRSQTGKSYFVEHSGIASAKGRSNRREEHCALALYGLKQDWPLSSGSTFEIIDYQVPLKARHADKGIGKIDLVGVSSQGRLIVIELKVESESGGKSDSPPSAMMEGLRYAAMIEADIDAVVSEAAERFGRDVVKQPPTVQVLAPQSWWLRWLGIKSAGSWPIEMAKMADAIETQCEVHFEFTALDNVEIIYGVDGAKPQLNPTPRMRPVNLRSRAPLEDQ